MTVLGIETSCDETAAAVLSRDDKTGQLTLLSSAVASSLTLHAQTGGIIPEIAAREQVKYILPVITKALEEGVGFSLPNAPKGAIPPIDAIAVTYGPGLIGSLLVGVETAKTLALLWNKPLIPVNHLYGHVYANLLTTKNQQPTTLKFPAVALVVSGGHTDLILMQSHEDITVIGGTRDDAAGEAFDKIGRLLNLPYPAGPIISRLAEKGNPKAFDLPRPMLGSHDFDFSFSGLKTAVLNLNKKQGWNFTDEQFAKENQQLLSDICASVQAAIIDVLVRKTLKAVKHYQANSLLIGGGVAANEKLAKTFSEKAQEQDISTHIFIPERSLCTDNAAMIAAASFFTDPVAWEEVTANPELYF